MLISLFISLEDFALLLIFSFFFFLFLFQLHEKQKGGRWELRWNTLEIAEVSWIYQLRERLGGIRIY